MTTLTQQIYQNLPDTVKNSLKDKDDNITIIQINDNTIWCKILRFGKYEEKLTVSRTQSGQIKKNSVRFFE